MVEESRAGEVGPHVRARRERAGAHACDGWDESLARGVTGSRAHPSARDCPSLADWESCCAGVMWFGPNLGFPLSFPFFFFFWFHFLFPF